MTITMHTEFRSAFREILPTLIPLMVVSAIAGGARSRSRVISGGCEATLALAEVAAERHLTPRAVDGQMLARAGHLLEARIGAEVRWLLPEDRAELHDLASEAPAALLERFSSGECALFERYTSVALRGLNRARAAFPDDAALAATLPAEPPDATPPGVNADPVNLEDLRRQLSVAALVEAQGCRPFAPWIECTGFGARRVLRRISDQLGHYVRDEGTDWLDALVASFDPHSRFIQTAELRSLQFDGPTPGLLGIRLGRAVPGGVQILEVVRDSPAGISGSVHAEDVLSSIDGTALDGLGSDEVDQMLRNSGESSILGISPREGAHLGPLRLVRLTRRVLGDRSRIMRVSVRSTSSDRIAVVRLLEFTHDAPAEVERAIRIASRVGDLSAVVLDLRGNPGGGLQASVSVAGLFLNGGPVIARVGGAEGRRVYSDDDPSSIFDGPLLLLVDDRTASGAEIVAGALQARGRALVVGSPRTFGKGSIQELIAMELTQSALGLTSALYFLPDGRSPQLTGVLADVVIAHGVPDGEREPGLEGALPHPPDIEPLVWLPEGAAAHLSRMRAAARTSVLEPASGARRDPDEVLGAAVQIAGAIAALERPDLEPRVTANASAIR